MDLFHQTVSMKSVGNLNEFVRSHMLEPFDSAAWVDRLIAHFENLTRRTRLCSRPARSCRAHAAAGRLRPTTPSADRSAS